MLSLFKSGFSCHLVMSSSQSETLSQIIRVYRNTRMGDHLTAVFCYYLCKNLRLITARISVKGSSLLKILILILVCCAMADPGFPVGGVDPLGGCEPPTRVLFGQNVCENKRIGSSSGACAGHDPPRSANAVYVNDCIKTLWPTRTVYCDLPFIFTFKWEIFSCTYLAGAQQRRLVMVYNTGFTAEFNGRMNTAIQAETCGGIFAPTSAPNPIRIIGTCGEIRLLGMKEAKKKVQPEKKHASQGNTVIYLGSGFLSRKDCCNSLNKLYVTQV